MNRKEIVTLILILLFSAILRIALIPPQLPFHYQSDEFQVIERALRMGTGELNPGLFTWPGSLTIYLNFALYGIYFLISTLFGGVSSASEFARAYWTNPAPFYVIGRAISAAFGLLAVVSVYFAARRLAASMKADGVYISGLFAAVAAALVPEMVIDSAFALPDMAATGLTAFSFALALTYFAKPRRATAVAAGVAMGAAIACKYNAAFLAPAVIGAILLAENRAIKSRFADGGIALALIPVAFILFCPFAVLDFATFSGDIAGLMQRQGMVVWAPDIRFLFSETLGLALTHRFILLVIVSAIAVLFTRNKRVIAIFALAVLPLLLVAIPRPLPPRHLLPLYPVLCIILGVGAGFLYSKLKDKMGKTAGVTLAVVYAIFLFTVLVADVKHTIWSYREDSRSVALAYIEETLPADSAILTEAIEPDITGPMLWPNRESLERILTQEREAGKMSGGRYGYLLKDSEYPYGKTVYNIHLVEFGIPEPGDINYAILTEPDDERFFAEQTKYPGTVLTAWDSEYRAYLSENGRLLDTFSGEDRPGPTIHIYEIE